MRPGSDAGPAEWTFPAAGLEWRQPEILAVAEFDGDGDDGDLAVLLDGRDLTERFLPSWPAVFGPGADEEEEGTGRTAAGPDTGSRRRRAITSTRIMRRGSTG